MKKQIVLGSSNLTDPRELQGIMTCMFQEDQFNSRQLQRPVTGF